MNPLPLTDPTGRVMAYACGRCLHVGVSGERDRLAETEAALCAEVRRLKAELHREREANRPLRHEVEQLRARLPDPSPGTGRVES